MNLTVSELALAVGKQENYVRQHIHRRHLDVRRQGRSVWVPLDEAVKWAGTRGLPFVPPKRVSLTLLDQGERIGRLTVLVSHPRGGKARNLFTFMRHRRREALGPWPAKPDVTWKTQELGDDLSLMSFNAAYEQCREHVDSVLASGVLQANEEAIHYVLEAEPRHHWAYRDYGRRLDASIHSPFSMHSAAITEYWSFEEEPKKRWLSLSDPLAERLGTALRRLGFPLDRRPERVGNLLIAAAEDAITCRLTAHHDQTLRLHVEASGLLPETYRATVWASHSGDEVLRREVPVTPGQTTIELGSQVDRTGFAVCRDFDGQYVDLVENLPGVEAVQARLREGQAPRRSLDPVAPVPQQVHPSRPEAPVPGRFLPTARLDRGIRQQWLHRVARQREAGARRDANLVRFGPGRFEEAARHFLRLIGNDADHSGPVYLADPCFVGHTMADEVAQLFSAMCAAIQGRPLRILCAEREPGDAPAWWARYLRRIRASVTVRTFVNRSDERGCFHDRYLITGRREILMTNSFNGWSRFGVTFVSLPYGVYRAEAEQLWALELNTPASDVLVREFS